MYKYYYVSNSVSFHLSRAMLVYKSVSFDIFAFVSVTKSHYVHLPFLSVYAYQSASLVTSSLHCMAQQVWWLNLKLSLLRGQTSELQHGEEPNSFSKSYISMARGCCVTEGGDGDIVEALYIVVDVLYWEAPRLMCSQSLLSALVPFYFLSSWVGSRSLLSDLFTMRQRGRLNFCLFFLCCNVPVMFWMCTVSVCVNNSMIVSYVLLPKCRG